MANEEHSTLTGSSLHEPKGAAAAAVNKVYVSDGAGSGTWQKLTDSQLTGTGNSFGSQLMHVREEQSSGVASSTSLTHDVFSTIALNTLKTNEISGSSLASNQIVLPAGTYFLEGGIALHTATDTAGKLRLYNITDSTTSVEGLNQGQDGTSTTTLAFIKGRFTLSGTKTLELQFRSGTSVGGGSVTSFGTEVFADVLIWKVA